MATIDTRRTASGVKFLGRARVSGFKPLSKLFDTRAEAKKWATDTETELRKLKAGRKLRADPAALTVAGLIQSYLAEDNTQALNTIADIRQRLAWFINEYPAVKVREFGSAYLREARDKLKASGKSPSTCNRYLSSMRSAWNWAREGDVIPPEYTFPRRLMLKEPKARTRFASGEELNRLLDAGASDPVVLAAIIISAGTGMRQGELLSLRPSVDVDLKAATAIIRKSKTDTQRNVHLPETAVAAFQHLLSLPVVSPNSFFLNGAGSPLDRWALDKRWDKIRKAAKLKDFRWHDLRHTFASHTLQNGATLGQIGIVLGHTNAQTTMRYAHLIPGAALPGTKELNDKLTVKK